MAAKEQETQVRKLREYSPESPISVSSKTMSVNKKYESLSSSQEADDFAKDLQLGLLSSNMDPDERRKLLNDLGMAEIKEENIRPSNDEESAFI